MSEQSIFYKQERARTPKMPKLPRTKMPPCQKRVLSKSFASSRFKDYKNVESIKSKVSFETEVSQQMIQLRGINTIRLKILSSEILLKVTNMELANQNLNPQLACGLCSAIIDEADQLNHWLNECGEPPLWT